MNKALRNRILIIVGIIIVSILLFFGIFFLLNIFFGYKPSSSSVTNLENDKVNIEIKRTEGYFVNELGAKEYIFEINVDKIKDYYFPD